MLSAALPELEVSSWLEQEAAAAPWCVVVGRPSPGVLVQIQQCAGPVLVVVPDLELQERLEQLIDPWPEHLHLRVACVGPDVSEVDWWLFNDSRFNGLIPLGHWLQDYPNLRLVGQERRQQQPLAALLEDQLTAQQRGLLVVADEPDCCIASLAGLGTKAEWIAALAVMPLRDGVDPAVVDHLLAQTACLKAISQGGDDLLWRFDLNQQLALVEAERDLLLKERNALAVERDALIKEQAQLDRELDALVNERDALVNERDALVNAVSYTHLTLPTILRV